MTSACGRTLPIFMGCLLKTALTLIFFFCIPEAVAQNRSAHFDGSPDYYNCGSISVTGNQLTVEALIRRQKPFLMPGQTVNWPNDFYDAIFAGNIWTNSPGSFGLGNVNAWIRTSAGDFGTTRGLFYGGMDSFYHVAMTYNGSSLKYYVNGCVISEVSATGSLVATSSPFRIGQDTLSSADVPFRFNGDVDEVRVWSVARTTEQLRAFFHDLPNPTTQAGLLAYYKFEGNVNNVQGNALYNGVPAGTPQIVVQDSFSRATSLDAVVEIVREPSCNVNNGQIRIFSSGGYPTSGHTYSVDGSAWTPIRNFSDLAPGQHIARVQSNTGCIKTFTFNLTSPCMSTATTSFTAPDTVCVNEPVNILNTSSGVSSYLWNFCTANINTSPTGINMGNPGNQLTTPCFMDYAFENGNWYGFIVSNNPPSLVRLNFGNSLLNTPTAVNLGDFGGILPLGAQGIQLVQEGGRWYAIITGGDVNAAPWATSRIIKVDFGTTLTNTSPTVTNWGNIGNMNYPVDLFMFKDAGTWHGFTVNYYGGTITRFNFGPNFDNPPTGVNLGALGGMNQPSGLCPINDNGTWRLFVANFGNSTLSRIDFGNSLLNAPSGAVNLGTLGGTMRKPRDLYIFNYCNESVAFVVNDETHDMVRLKFNSLSSTPTATSLGNVAGFQNPHSISKLFRVGSDLFGFVPNAYVNNVSRIRFPGCSNSSTPNSTLQSPPPVTYNTPGIYNITLTTDEGLPTQSAFCKQVVVLAPPTITPLSNSTICPGGSTTLSPVVSGATTYTWSPATGLSNPNIANPVASPATTTQYILTASNGGRCAATATVTVNVQTPLQCGQVTVTPAFTAPDTVCVNNPVNITNTTVGASSYFWNFCVADVNTTPTAVNLGNPGSFLSQPVFVDMAEQNGNYYGFVVNHFPGGITRLDFGNSLLNTPTPVFLGNPGNAMNAGYGNEGIQIVQSNGNWYGIIVGGNPASSSTPRLVIVKFGANLNNPTPTAVNWGNIGNMLEPIDLHVFQENGNWYGLTVNAESNSITRFNFGNSFENAPTGTNLGNIGGLNYPDGIYAINDNGIWRVFVTNGRAGNSSLSRLDFGSSLLNAPTGVNLGNIGGQFSSSRDITLLKYCGQTVGFVVNGSNTILRLNFSSLTAPPTVSNLGNLGNLSFPHSLSKLFRAGNDIYSLITNVSNNTITRVKFTGCTASSIPNSSLQTPPPVIYNTPGTYNINLTVDDGLPTQNALCKQVVVMPALAHQPTKNLAYCNGSNVKIGAGIKPAVYLWSTGETSDSIVVNTPGTYWVETSRFGCVVRDSFVVTMASGSPVDFAYQQDICSPKTINFTSTLTNASQYEWDFGNSQLNNSSLTPIMTYADYGTYTIKLKATYLNGCKDSVVKTIIVDNAFDGLLLGNSDTTICLGDSILLRPGSQISNFCWRTSAGPLPSAVTGYVKPLGPTTYLLTSQVIGNNLVTNADFTAGNTGFTSEYNYTTSNSAEGQYWIGPNASAWNGGMSNCGDHTSGSGNMMIINGSPVANARVWTQTIAVTPGTNYTFSTWIASMHSSNPARLQFAINGTNLGNNISASSTTCQWNRFSADWNSGSSTSATITVINNNTILDGNDFALDDIFFGTTVTKNDSFTVNLTGLCDSIRITGTDRICSATNNYTYSVYRPAGCSQPFNLAVDPVYADVIVQTVNSVTLAFKKNGQTNVKVSYANSCKRVEDSLVINVKLPPSVINFGPDLTTCSDTSFILNAGDGFASYQWSNGSTDSTLSVNAPGTYSIIAQTLCGVQFRDTIVYTRNIVIPFAASPMSPSVCAPDSVQFSASGGTAYQWQPAAKFSNANSPSPRALVETSQNYFVQITDAVCARDTLIAIPVIASDAANISVTKSNDVTCGNDSAVLIATGGISYLWTPNSFITRNSNGQITVKPPQTMTFYVQGTDASGCKGIDSVTVAFTKTGDQQLFMPTGFTPNGDGLNDVFRPTFIGPATKFDFRIYNRWGQLVFRTNKVGSGWNGIFNGVPQRGDAFVYYITAEGGCNGRFEQKGTFVLIR
jgi:gliding motility-associated-like protein